MGYVTANGVDGPTYTNDPLGVVGLGDSLMDSNYFLTWAWPTVLSEYLPGANVYSAGIVGSDSASVLARVESSGILGWNAWSRGAESSWSYYTGAVCVVEIGTNDVSFDIYDHKGIIANLEATYAKLEAMGITVISGTIPPINNLTPVRENERVLTNQWIIGNAPNPVDFEVLGSGATPVNQYQPRFFHDGVHPNAEASRVMAELIAAAINEALPDYPWAAGEGAPSSSRTAFGRTAFIRFRRARGLLSGLSPQPSMKLYQAFRRWLFGPT